MVRWRMPVELSALPHGFNQCDGSGIRNQFEVEVRATAICRRSTFRSPLLPARSEDRPKDESAKPAASSIQNGRDGAARESAGASVLTVAW